MEKCPLCGGRVTYEGVVQIECAGQPECRNYKAPRSGEAEKKRSDELYAAWPKQQQRSYPGYGIWFYP